MSEGSPRPGSAGLRAALARTGDAALGLVRTRLELAALEFSEERERAKTTVVLTAVAGVFLGFALLWLSVLVVFLLWDTNRVAAVVGVTLVHLAIGAWALLRLREHQKSASQAFALTLAELDRDRRWLVGGLHSNADGGARPTEGEARP